MAPSWFTPLVLVWMALAVLVLPSLLKVAAPYGRHDRERLGPRIPSRWGWIVMEAPSPLGMIYCLATAGRPVGAPALALFGLWQLHYLYRSFVYPLRRRDERSM